MDNYSAAQYKGTLRRWVLRDGEENVEDVQQAVSGNQDLVPVNDDRAAPELVFDQVYGHVWELFDDKENVGDLQLQAMSGSQDLVPVNDD